MLDKIPCYILEILKALNGAGFEAYIVGGAVRDLLLGLEPNDYDITTSARPEETISLCKAKNWPVVDNLGNNFGCVVALIQGNPCEITTFRGEKYSNRDSHRPSEVWFCNDLKSDLSRRDFTINAMAMDSNGKIYDYFSGQQDLLEHKLRTVGKPSERFQEDALRMLRACRFVAQLGFEYVQDENVLPGFGMEKSPYYLPHSFNWPVELCSGLSLTRVRVELEKLLTAPYAGKGLMLFMATSLYNQSCTLRQNGSTIQVPILPELGHLVGLAQNPRFHLYDVWEHTLLAVDNSPQDLVLRWAMLLHDVAKGLPGIRGTTPDGQPNDHGHEAESAHMAKPILERFQYNDKFTQKILWLVAEHMRFAPILFYKHLSDNPQYRDPVNIRKTILKWIRTEATSGHFHRQQDMVDSFQQLKYIYLADMGATHAGKNTELMAEGQELADLAIDLAQNNMPVSSSDLDINGNELLELVKKEQLKAMLSYLLERVQSQNLPNEKAALLAAVEKKLKRRV